MLLKQAQILKFALPTKKKTEHAIKLNTLLVKLFNFPLSKS